MPESKNKKQTITKNNKEIQREDLSIGCSCPGVHGKPSGHVVRHFPFIWRPLFIKGNS